MLPCVPFLKGNIRCERFDREFLSQNQNQKHCMKKKSERGGRVWVGDCCCCTYAKGLKVVIQNQLLPTSGTVIVRTRATLARLMQVQKVSNAAWPRLGTIMPSNLHSRSKEKLSISIDVMLVHNSSLISKQTTTNLTIYLS